MLLEQNKPLVSSEVTSTLHSRFIPFNVLYASLHFVHTGRPIAPQHKHDLRIAFSILTQRICDRSYREERLYHIKYHSGIALILSCFTSFTQRVSIYVSNMEEKEVGMNVTFRSWLTNLSGKWEVLWSLIFACV